MLVPLLASLRVPTSKLYDVKWSLATSGIITSFRHAQHRNANKLLAVYKEGMLFHIIELAAVELTRSNKLACAVTPAAADTCEPIATSQGGGLLPMVARLTPELRLPSFEFMDQFKVTMLVMISCAPTFEDVQPCKYVCRQRQSLCSRKMCMLMPDQTHSNKCSAWSL